MVVLRIVVHVSSDVLLLDAADAVFEAGSSGQRIRSRECFGIARVGHERRRVRSEFQFDLRQRIDVGNRPRLGAVGEITVREIEHRRHVFERKSHCFDGHVETVSRCRRRNDDRRTLAVASPNSLK